MLEAISGWKLLEDVHGECAVFVPLVNFGGTLTTEEINL
jgi:hypothetical protein